MFPRLHSASHEVGEVVASRTAGICSWLPALSPLPRIHGGGEDGAGVSVKAIDVHRKSGVE